MAWIDDIDLLNNAATSGNWTASGFDTPTLNDSAATTPIYLEGSSCMWWPLKKGTTNGYVYTNTISGTPTLTGRVVVGFLNYPFADIDLIPITALSMRLSSATTYTTNYLQWNASTQLLSPENIPISGHTPIVGYEDAGTETGTFNGNAESVGWVATTGNDADGKQGGFDWFLLVGWVGAHSATLTNTFFSGLYSEYYDNDGSGLPGQTSRPIGVLSKSGDFYQSNIRFQLGDGTSDTANLVVSETAKTIFFNNLHANHELGYIFVDPASTYTNSLTLTNCVHFWNDQAAGNEVFDGVANVAVFKLDGCSFSRGGGVALPAHDTDSTTYVKNSKFDDCGPVDVGDILFEDNTVSSNTSTTGAIEMTDTGHNVARTAITGNTYGMYFAAAGTYTIDGDQFSGNTYDIHFGEVQTAIDSNSDTPNGNFSSNNYYWRGQSFTGDGKYLTKITVDLLKTGSPTGTIACKVYAHSGTYGTSSVPTGTAIATSSTTVNATSLTTSAVSYDFIFDGTVQLVNTTYYVFTIEGPLGDASNQWHATRLTTTGTHGGNTSRYNGTWSAGTSGTDWAPFTVYGLAGSGGGTLTLNAVNGANPSTSYTPGGGTVVINNAVTVAITAKTVAGANVENARVRLMKVSDDSVVLEGLTNASGVATTSFNYLADTDVYGWVRKSTSSPLYKEAPVSGTITSGGFSSTALMVPDE